MKLSKVHVIITSGLTQTSAVFWFGKKYISEFCLRVYTSTVNSRRLAYAPFEFYFQHLRNHLASGARSLTNMSSMWNPPSPYLLTFWHFTLWHEKRFFRKWMGYNRCIQALPFFLPLIFAGSLFHCSLTIFARLPWPRARHRLTQRPEIRLNFHFAL